MVDRPITKQELIDAQKDAKSLGEATNEDKVVQSRYGGPYKSVPMLAREGEEVINAIRQAGLKVQLTSSTSFAEPDIVFGLYAVQREFSIARQDAHIASADTEQQIKVGVFKNDTLFCEIIFLQNSHQFNFLSDLTEFMRGDVIRLKLTEFHYSVKEIAVSLLGRFKIYEE